MELLKVGQRVTATEKNDYVLEGCLEVGAPGTIVEVDRSGIDDFPYLVEYDTGNSYGSWVSPEEIVPAEEEQ